MTIIVEHRRKNQATLTRQYTNAQIIDVTSRGPQPWVKFSPFYPHGNIPIPLSPGHTAASVEGIWQGLKVFHNADIDPAAFANTTMKGLKRTVRTNGPVLGHRAGVDDQTLLSYREARFLIYLPAYRWVLEHALQPELEQLSRLSRQQAVILLDYETNTDVENLAKPLSHAALIQMYLTNQWPMYSDASLFKQ